MSNICQYRANRWIITSIIYKCLELPINYYLSLHDHAGSLLPPFYIYGNWGLERWLLLNTADQYCTWGLSWSMSSSKTHALTSVHHCFPAPCSSVLSRVDLLEEQVFQKWCLYITHPIAIGEDTSTGKGEIRRLQGGVCSWGEPWRMGRIFTYRTGGKEYSWNWLNSMQRHGQSRD